MEAEQLEKGIRNSVLEIVKKRDFQLRSGEMHSFGDDFLGVHLKEYNDPNAIEKISIGETIDQCMAFYSAGQASTSILLSWTILLLAMHTDWQEKARQEVFRLFGQQTPNSEGISRLKTVCNQILLSCDNRF